MNYDNFTKEQIVSIFQDTLEYLSNLREEIKGLKKEIELYEDNQIHLINQLEQKDNIIKEVREYTNDLLKLKENDYFDLVDKSYIKKYLKILDKVEEKENGDN